MILTAQDSSETESNIGNPLRCQRGNCRFDNHGILRQLQYAMKISVVFTIPIAVAAFPVRASLHTISMLYFLAPQSRKYTALLTQGAEDPQLEEKTGHIVLFGLRMSSAQILSCYFAFSGVAAGLIYLQRSNPLFKTAFLLFCTAMVLLSVFKGTESMLEVLPWAIMGMLSVSGLLHACAKFFWASAKDNGQQGGHGTAGHTVKDKGQDEFKA